MTTTITGNYNATVIMSNSQNSPLTVEAQGIIDPPAYAGAGVYVVFGQSGVTQIVNYGQILGAIGSPNKPDANGYEYTGGYGGDGVADDFSAVNLNNAGTIAGGTGGTSYHVTERYHAGNGGFGVAIQSQIASTVSNSGHIYGGDGGYGQFYGGDGGTGVDVRSKHAQVSNSGFIRGGDGGDGFLGDGGLGGYGVFLERKPTMQNTGTIIGGTGGYTYSGNSIRGGDGVDLNGAVLTNKGEIAGGTGGTSGNGLGGQGGAGAVIGYSGGTLINAGTITGGAGGYAEYYHSSGPMGDAVYLFASNTGKPVVDKLVVDPGAVFIGDVVASPTNRETSEVLQLAGTSSVALTGIGTQFDGFGTISFAAGAAWKIEGTEAALTTGESIKGFSQADQIEITNVAAASGEVSVKTKGVVTIEAGGETYKLDIAGAKKGETDFNFSNDTLTKTGSSKMAFLTPPPTAAPDASLPALHDMAPEPAKPETGGWITQAALPGATLPDLTHIPHGAVQAMLTLQSG